MRKLICMIIVIFKCFYRREGKGDIKRRGSNVIVGIGIVMRYILGIGRGKRREGREKGKEGGE